MIVPMFLFNALLKVFEAFSRVVQKLMPEQQYSTLENLLNDLISNSNMEKTFLFDVVSKIYIATDSNPVDMHSYELCSDMIDVVSVIRASFLTS
jgi:Ras-related GTP-binding protein C/D